MRYQLLGRSGLRVSELCLGTMTFGEDWGMGATKQVSQQMFDRFTEAGGNFIDTSVNYNNTTSEKFVGEFIQSNRDYFVVATKFSLKSDGENDPNKGGNARKNMMRSVEQSLRQLQTDYIDVLYLHVWDHMTPVDEVMRGMDDLVRMGKVHYLALSDTPAWIMAEANTRAELMGWSRFVGYQLPYSLVNRSIERAEIPAAKHWDMAVLPWSILGSGLLTGKYSAQNSDPKRMGNRPVSEREQKIIDAVQAIATETGCSPSQVAINWVRQQQQRAQIIPILGTRTMEQLEDNLAVLEWELTPTHLAQLDEVSQIEHGFPRDFVEGAARQFIFGKTFDLIDNTHRTYSPK